MAKRKAPPRSSGGAVEAEDWRRCRVVSSVTSTGHDFSKALGPDALVDLNEEIWPGRRLRQEVKDEWFDPPEKLEQEKVDPEPEPEPEIDEESDHGA